MANFSARPSLSDLKKSVLNLIKGLTTKSIFRGIDILMSPCCNITSEAVITCGSNPGYYNVTITYTPKPNYLGRGALIIQANTSVITGDIYDDSGKVEIVDALISGSPGDPVTLNSTFLMATSPNVEDLSVGVYQASETSTTLPTCVF